MRWFSLLALMACQTKPVDSVGDTSNTEDTSDTSQLPADTGEDTSGETDSPVVDFVAVQDVFEQYCTSCHFYGGSQPNLTADEATLLEYMSQDPCVAGEAVPLVQPGSPQTSYLMFKITGESDLTYEDECSELMPQVQNGPPNPLIDIDSDAVAVISTWISSLN